MPRLVQFHVSQTLSKPQHYEPVLLTYYLASSSSITLHSDNKIVSECLHWGRGSTMREHGKPS